MAPSSTPQIQTSTPVVQPYTWTSILDANGEMDVHAAAAWMQMSLSTFRRWRKRRKVLALDGERFSREQLLEARRREAAEKQGYR